MITQLQLKNFTAFTELAIDFSPGINIIIGENGTGKTQLLKALLALCGPAAWHEQADEQLARNQHFPEWPLRRDAIIEAMPLDGAVQ